MKRKRIIPALLLKGEGLYKGIKFNKYQYIGDPLNAVKIFSEKEVDELIFFDITANSENRFINPEIVKSIADECYMPFGVGGGIKSITQIATLLKAGAEKVVLSTFAINNLSIIEESSKVFGSQAIVVSVDYKKNLFGKQVVYIKSGKEKTQFTPVELCEKIAELGAGEIILNSIDNDGTMTGLDLDMIKKVSDKVNVPVIALGGCGNLEHINEAFLSGASAVAAGSMFVYHGPRRGILINYPDKNEMFNL